jgi:uncharacterized protein
MMEWMLLVLIAIVAFAYAMVGHGGASGYLALMGVMGFAPEVMKPSALLLNLCVSAIAFAQYARAGHFQWRSFWPFAIASVPFAFLGGSVDLDTVLYKRILGGCIVLAALRLFGVFGNGTMAKREAPIALALVIGAAIGLLSGMLGIGGGVLLSPVLLLCAWADAKTAAAISAPFIFVNSVAGLAGMGATTDVFSMELMMWVGAAIAGGVFGAWIGARRAPEPRLRQALAVVLVLASIKLIWP